MKSPRSLQELFADSKHWIKGRLAIDDYGRSIEPNHYTATCWCLLGGIRRVYGYTKQTDEIYSRIEKFLNLEFTYTTDQGVLIRITLWNDHPNRTFEDIQKLVKELNI